VLVVPRQSGDPDGDPTLEHRRIPTCPTTARRAPRFLRLLPGARRDHPPEPRARVDPADAAGPGHRRRRLSRRCGWLRPAPSRRRRQRGDDPRVWSLRARGSARGATRRTRKLPRRLTRVEPCAAGGCDQGSTGLRFSTISRSLGIGGNGVSPRWNTCWLKSVCLRRSPRASVAVGVWPVAEAHVDRVRGGRVAGHDVLQ
jgi:hypothetical protein